MLFLDKESGPVLEIQLKDEKIFVAENEEEDTKSWYQMLSL